MVARTDAIDAGEPGLALLQAGQLEALLHNSPGHGYSGRKSPLQICCGTEF